MAEVLLRRSLPGGDDVRVDFGFLIEDTTGQINEFGARNLGEDTFHFVIDYGARHVEFSLLPGQQFRRNVPDGIVAEQRPNGRWRIPYDRFVVERVFAVPITGSPTILSVTTTEFNTATTGHACALGSTWDADDGALVIFGGSAEETVHAAYSATPPSGFDEILDPGNAQWFESPDDWRVTVGVYAKAADGSEDGTTATVTTSIAVGGSSHVYRFQAGTWSGTATDITTADAMVSDGNADPPNHTPPHGSQDYSWIAVGITDNDGIITGAPSSYTNLTLTDSNSISDSNMGTAWRALEAASENPGTFTQAEVENCVGVTIAIPPPMGGGGGDPIWVTGYVMDDASVDLPFQIEALPVAPLSDAQVIVVGTASEVETAQAVVALKPIRVAIGTASESETAQAVPPRVTVPIGVATEVSTAQAVIALKPIISAVGVATEVGTAQTVIPLKPIFVPVGSASEVGTAQLVVPRKTVTVGPAGEAETAQAVQVIHPIVVPIGAATEAETAQAVRGVKTVLVGVAQEAGTAHTIAAVKPIVVLVGTASEVGTAALVAATKAVAVGLASEAESAQAVAVLKPIFVAVGSAGEVETAVVVDVISSDVTPVGVASETETAQVVTPVKPVFKMVGTALETETAQAVTAVKPIVTLVGPATEVGTAQTVVALKPIVTPVGTATEVGSAQAVGAIKPIFVPVGAALEAELAHQVIASKPIVVPIGVASEVGQALGVGAIHFVPVGVAVEAGTAHGVGIVKPIIVMIGRAQEFETAQVVGKPIIVAVGTAMETESGHEVIAITGLTIVDPAGVLYDVIPVPPIVVEALDLETVVAVVVEHSEVDVVAGSHAEDGVTWRPTVHDVKES